MWPLLMPSLKTDQVKRLKELEKENERLRKTRQALRLKPVYPIGGGQLSKPERSDCGEGDGREEGLGAPVHAGWDASAVL